MGKNIGSLGRKREPLDLEFDYFGAKVRVHPMATDAVEIEFLEAGRDLDLDDLMDLDLAKLGAMSEADQASAMRRLSAAEQEAYKALIRSMHRLIHPDDFAAYWRIGNENGQQVVDRMRDIKAITEAVVEARTDFPTQQPSLSATGPSATPPSSEAALPSPEVADFEMAMALERGRPDIQEFFVMEREARDRAAREERDRAAADRQKMIEAGLA